MSLTAQQFRRSLFWMVVAGLSLRLVVVSLVYTAQLDPAQDSFAFGYEAGRIARSLALGQGFSAPYHEATGPTAQQTPVYPYLLAGVFQLFGIYTATSALVILTLNSLFSALTCIPVALVAREAFGPRVAWWAGWAWAIFPYAVLMSTLIWETTLTTLLLSLLVLATVRLVRPARPAAWLGYGGLWGLAALTSPSVLSCLPLWVWVWYRHREQGTRGGQQLVWAAMGLLIVLAPWQVRNDLTFDRFVFLRDNFALEFHVGNSDDTRQPSNFNVLPGDNPAEMEKYKRLGELAYMAELRQEARELVARQPGRYAWLTLRRIVCVWTGLWVPVNLRFDDQSGVPNIMFCTGLSVLAWIGLRRALREHREYAILFGIVLTCFPLIYYAAHPDIRYRHPLDPFLVPLAVHAVSHHLARRDLKNPQSIE